MTHALLPSRHLRDTRVRLERAEAKPLSAHDLEVTCFDTADA
jgi:hypothetical protein